MPVGEAATAAACPKTPIIISSRQGKDANNLYLEIAFTVRGERAGPAHLPAPTPRHPHRRHRRRRPPPQRSPRLPSHHSSPPPPPPHERRCHYHCWQCSLGWRYDRGWCLSQTIATTTTTITTMTRRRGETVSATIARPRQSPGKGGGRGLNIRGREVNELDG